LIKEHVLRLTPTEVAQIDAALDEDPCVNPELARLIRRVKEPQAQAAKPRAGASS
jgi:uncharacterized protein (DUF1778 family)